MRGLFSFIGLLVVVAILAVIARSQLHTLQTPPDAAAGLPAASSASASFAQRASAVPQQIANDVNQLMQQRPQQLDDTNK